MNPFIQNGESNLFPSKDVLMHRGVKNNSFNLVLCIYTFVVHSKCIE